MAWLVNPQGYIQTYSQQAFVTWEAPPTFTVSLAGPLFGPGTYTATTNTDVGPTPYYIEIFDAGNSPANLQNWSRIAVCGAGTSCSVYWTPKTTGNYLVAFVSDLDPRPGICCGAEPPFGTQANSQNLFTLLSAPPS
jgi:hypothetical protein